MTDAATIAQRLGLRRLGAGFGGSCPRCGYRGFSLGERGGRTLVRCHAGGCSQAEVLAVLRERDATFGGPPNASADGGSEPAHARRSTTDLTVAARRLWAASRVADGTAAESYLRNRGMLGLVPPTLRFLPRVRHAESGTWWPIVIAAVEVSRSPGLVAVHRTFLLPDGAEKAPVTPAKKTLGPVRGGAVRLAEAGAAIAVTEGIETGLSVLAATAIPTWAALSAGGVEALTLPALPLAAEVIICADHDRRGLRAAARAAARWTREGRKVRVAVPPRPGTDFNDLHQAPAGAPQ